MVKDKHGEKWADIWGYYGRYQISNLGRVKGLERYAPCKNGKQRKVNSRVIGTFLNECGYVYVWLCKPSRQRCFRVSRLVAKYFLKNPFNKPQVDHIFGNKKDNRASSLEWVTRKENMKRASFMRLINKRA